MTLGASAIGATAIGATAIGASPRQQVLIAIENTDLMPDDAKRAIKNYIKDTFNEVWNTFEELIEVHPPSELLEYWDIVLQIVQSLAA